MCGAASAATTTAAHQLAMFKNFSIIFVSGTFKIIMCATFTHGYDDGKVGRLRVRQNIGVKVCWACGTLTYDGGGTMKEAKLHLISEEYYDGANIEPSWVCNFGRRPYAEFMLAGNGHYSLLEYSNFLLWSWKIRFNILDKYITFITVRFVIL